MKKILIAAVLVFAAGLGASAADKGSAKPAEDRQQMIEMHQKMADLHSKAAECLKAGKDIKECHDAMVKDCPMARTGHCPFSEGACPMCAHGMKGKGRGKGMMHGMGAGTDKAVPETQDKK